MAAKNLSNDSLGILYQDRRNFYLGEQITRELWTDVAPFTTIMANLSGGIETGLRDPEYKMFEHRGHWFRQTMKIAADPGAWATNGSPGELNATAFAVDNKKGLGSNAAADESLIGLVFEVYSAAGDYKGIVTVHDVISGEVKLRSLGNPRASNNRALALANTDLLVVAGSAIGEGETSPEAFADDLEVVWNSSQIFRTPLEITGTLHQAALRGYSNELARLRVDKQREHKVQKERAFLIGQRVPGLGDPGANGEVSGTHTKNKGGKTVRTTMGIISAQHRYGSADNTSDDQVVFHRAYASYTYNNFIDDSEKWFWYVPSNGYKTAIVGPSVMSFFAKLGTQGFHKGDQKVQISDLQRDKLQFFFRWLETPHGLVKLVMSPALRYEYKNYMTLIDEDNLRMTQYRPMYYATNIKTENNYDGIKDEYFSDEGIKLTLLETHKLVIFS